MDVFKHFLNVHYETIQTPIASRFSRFELETFILVVFNSEKM